MFYQGEDALTVIDSSVAPSPGGPLPGWRPTAWAAPEDSGQPGQRGLQMEPAWPTTCTPHRSPPPSSSPCGARCSPPADTERGLGASRM